MHIKDKCRMTRQQLVEQGPITIVAFGDSVTHGVLMGEINYETVYWNRLKRKIEAIHAPLSYIPVNVINAGIEGDSATGALCRIDRQVLIHQPDLVIVCFGLNDVSGELEDYVSSLRIIFEKCRSGGADVIFMTPNMLNTYVAEDTPPEFREFAAVTAQYQNDGRMDRYMAAAKAAAADMGIPVCDCYAQWKKRSETQDTTMLLANRINHPTQEMHELFADSLFRMIFAETP